MISHATLQRLTHIIVDTACWNSIPFGIAPEPEEFQMRIQQELEGLSEVFSVAGNILIFREGDTISEATITHDEYMKKFLQRCQSHIIMLFETKFWLKVPFLMQVGYVLTPRGYKLICRGLECAISLGPSTKHTGYCQLFGLLSA
jgi:hypothetical protein